MTTPELLFETDAPLTGHNTTWTLKHEGQTIDVKLERGTRPFSIDNLDTGRQISPTSKRGQAIVAPVLDAYVARFGDDPTDLKEEPVTTIIPTTGNPVVNTVYANIGANVSSEGFFRFTLDGVEFGPNFLGSWDQLNAVHTDLGILECKHRVYVGGEEAYSLEWPEEEFGQHPITNTWGRGDSVAEVYSDAALFLAGYHASKEG